MEIIGTCEAVKKYSFAVDRSGHIVGEVGDPEVTSRAGAALDRLTRAHMARTGRNYAEAFGAVRRDPANAALVETYAAVTWHQPDRVATEAEVGELARSWDDFDRGALDRGQDAGLAVDRLVRAHMATYGVKDYGLAMRTVLADPGNRELRQRYGAS